MDGRDKQIGTNLTEDRYSHGWKRLNGQTLLKTQTAWYQAYRRQEQPWTEETEWTDITEDTNSLVPILLKTGTAMDRRE